MSDDQSLNNTIDGSTPHRVDPRLALIITAPLRPIRLSLRGRLASVAIAVACGLVLLAAAYLAPDPAGIGTTTRLGMAPCMFPQVYDIPCGACGMTTAFNHAVRFEFIDAFWVQPAGLVLCVIVAAAFWVSLYGAVTAMPVDRLLERLPTVKLIIGFFALAIAAWAFKITITLLGMAGTS